MQMQPEVATPMQILINLIESRHIRIKISATKTTFKILFMCKISSSSVQFKMASTRLEKPICAPPLLSDVSLMLLLKQFQCSTDDWPFLSFQGRSSSASFFHASPLQAIDGVMSLALYPQVVSPTLLSTKEMHFPLIFVFK